MIKCNSKVLLVSCMDPKNPVLGGIETYSRNLLEFLLNNKIDTTLLGVSYNNLSTSANNYNFIPILHRKISGYYYLIKLCLMAPFIRISNSAIIYAQSPEYMLPFILFHRKNPKVIHLHGNILYLNRLERIRLVSLIYKIVETLVFKHSNLIITTDTSTVECYRKEYPWLDSRIIIIPTGINLELFKLLDRACLRKQYNFSKNDRVIMYIGRLAVEKNLDFLIRAYSILTKALPEAKLIFVGDGKEKRALQTMVDDMGLTKVRFLGIIPPTKIPEILNCADVFALCSTSEGSPNIIKEALACGVPVISTPVGDVPQIITSEKIGIIAPFNEQEYARLMLALLNKQNKEQVRENCNIAAKVFGFGETGKRVLEAMFLLSCH